ncbi:hypothetical protein COW36_11640 [bacterium (Candidatus Blackallbacteria) CG17_big_fil_post_rev_8_21_14_2_50_48_46]|uniref:Uncharacterized protein n=1 Tax=bacterium (Candidatus Blackallbacteria) CG17_big_fil_post_rev_8_21_14_2_50_48_46 TaxID=2014261 RepID=A0A2M7G4B3_9BACT|nr:MAG: hypothetical protein COW64_07075 [bacterium (Candidatus Blackallbacteria) CG18_big_fil_WC_8_21_14_2_50_49_26]PIW16746.1 MAG: hypothetical protein COW36_11640 [bacterium (Candidatus Blackallbacteria) CG17_big_fil_post_rev_8_21_14_2_50_48_46]PIW51171.1 MAG: hypothetical protein COW20_00060 [bacterium (Candidatus Blackallbacteria) CG13_big_fil_rev_8_21_14_2_50_49_14]
MPFNLSCYAAQVKGGSLAGQAEVVSEKWRELQLGQVALLNQIKKIRNREYYFRVSACRPTKLTLLASQEVREYRLLKN